MALEHASWRHESWPIAGSFTIARGSKTAADVVVVELRGNGHVGHGEAVPYARYQETVPASLAALDSCADRIRTLPSRAAIAALNLPYAARNALDCAMWDLECKQRGKPAWQVAGIARPKPVITAFTISLGTPEAMAEATRAAAGRPLLKIKLGREGDEGRLRSVRAAAPDARLIIDANEGWSGDKLPTMLALCAELGVELVEQPLPANADDALRNVTRPVLVCADESAHGINGLRHLKGKYDAINIKLDKTGGLTPALELAAEARRQGFEIMVGCMLATSLAMAPAFLLAGVARYIDLDGPLLLAKDRTPGIVYDGSIMQPPPPALWG